ncbi:hypothetical protein C4577_02750 [Candidatus Parcubacteria bacterium]|nr:MAG: hypothetical protein C4577_02750 [Candidatus Parcubacteria bacterium]
MKKGSIDNFSGDEDAVAELIYSLVFCKNFEDSVLFIQDLLTKSEIKILSRRLRIAKLLLDENTYEYIQNNMHVGHGTIAKISAWLNQKGEGFRKIIKQLPKESAEKPWFEKSDWDQIKRKYPGYFWPELLIEEIIKGSSSRQKGKITNLIKQLEKTTDEKSELYKHIESLMNKK